jgi:hypothetical protein
LKPGTTPVASERSFLMSCVSWVTPEWSCAASGASRGIGEDVGEGRRERTRVRDGVVEEALDLAVEGGLATEAEEVVEAEALLGPIAAECRSAGALRARWRRC